LTSRPAPRYRFSELIGKPAPASDRAGRFETLAILAKGNRGQAIENKRSREMTDFAPMNDLKDL
jgi:hypothetical protein